MQIAITREDDGAHGRYVARTPDGDAEADLTFTRRSDGLVSADHTHVPDSMGGQGVGAALIDAMRADARSEGFRIEPRCPYVRAQYEKHPDWADEFFSRREGPPPPG